jgi:hypothetical protein
MSSSSSVKRLGGGDALVDAGAADLITHRLDAKAADPAAHVACVHRRDVRRRAVLREPTALAPNLLHDRLGSMNNVG